VRARSALLGRVVGAPRLGGLAVTVYGEGGVLLASTTTDGNGYYGVADLPTGRTEVRVGGQRWRDTLGAGVTRYPDLLLRTLRPLP
jgi:hypothetical protein